MLPLQQFYTNETMREAVKAFLIDQLKEMAIETVFDKKATAGIYEARKVIDKAFDKLIELYKPEEKPVIESSR